MEPILVVDDEHAIADLVCLALENAGYRCRAAYSGAEAADLIEAGRWALVVLDVMLPDHDGPALIIVGMFMMSSVLKVKFEGDMADVLGAFVAIIMMPFTYSIANGIMFGVLTWMGLRIVRGKIRDIHPVMWIVFALFVIRIVTLVI